MALRVKILASGVFLLSAPMAASVAPSGAWTAYSLCMIGRAEARSVAAHGHRHQPHVEVKADLRLHPAHRKGVAVSTAHPATSHGQEIVFASSRVRWPQVVYGGGNGEGKKPAVVSDSGGVSALGRISVASLLPAPHVATREIGSVVECVSQAVAGEARGEVDTGQVGVANVIVNRLKTWGGSYCARVYDRHAGVCQFDGACHRYGAYTHEVAGRARTVALAAVTGQLHDVTGGALYFRVCQRGSERDPSFTVRIQNHCYFRDIPGLSRKDAIARSLEAVKQVKEKVGVKEVRLSPVTHIDYEIIPDKNGKYGFRVSETNRT